VELANNIENALGSDKEDNPSSHSSFLIPNSSLLEELTTALKNQNTADIDHIIADLNEMQIDAKTKEILEKISDEVLMTEFDKALKIIKELNANE